MLLAMPVAVGTPATPTHPGSYTIFAKERAEQATPAVERHWAMTSDMRRVEIFYQGHTNEDANGDSEDETEVFTDAAGRRWRHENQEDEYQPEENDAPAFGEHEYWIKTAYFLPEDGVGDPLWSCYISEPNRGELYEPDTGKLAAEIMTELLPPGSVVYLSHKDAFDPPASPIFVDHWIPDGYGTYGVAFVAPDGEIWNSLAVDWDKTHDLASFPF